MGTDLDAILGRITKYGVASYYSGPTFALIVGVSQYADPVNNIPSAAADVDAIAAFAARQGFENIFVVKDTSVSQELIKKCVLHAQRIAGQKDPISHPAAATRISRALFYFSGHGLPANAEQPARLLLHSYSDGIAKTQVGLNRSFIEPSDLENWSRDLSKFYQVLFVVDACHAGSDWFKWKSFQQATVTEWTLRSSLAARAVAGVGSSFNEQQSRQGPEDGGMSYFTAALIEGARSGDTDGDGLVTLSELVRYAKLVVPERTNNNQIPVGPYLLGSTQGSIVFVAEGTQSGGCPACPAATLSDCTDRFSTTASPPRWNGVGLDDELVALDYAIISEGRPTGNVRAVCSSRESQSLLNRKPISTAKCELGEISGTHSGRVLRADAYALETLFDFQFDSKCTDKGKLTPGFEVGWRIPFRLDRTGGTRWLDYQVDAAITSSEGFDSRCSLSLDGRSVSSGKFGGRLEGGGDHSFFLFCRNDRLPPLQCPGSLSQSIRLQLKISPRFRKGVDQ